MLARMIKGIFLIYLDEYRIRIAYRWDFASLESCFCKAPLVSTRMITRVQPNVIGASTGREGQEGKTHQWQCRRTGVCD